jgi:hypothetical protein
MNFVIFILGFLWYLQMNNSIHFRASKDPKQFILVPKVWVVWFIQLRKIGTERKNPLNGPLTSQLGLTTSRTSSRRDCAERRGTGARLTSTRGGRVQGPPEEPWRRSYLKWGSARRMWRPSWSNTQRWQCRPPVLAGPPRRTSYSYPGIQGNTCHAWRNFLAHTWFRNK